MADTDEKKRALREKYAANKSKADKEKRMKREQEEKEGRTDDRNLAFLENLIESAGYNQKTFSEKVGTTPQAINWIFSVKDDCNLSKVEEFVSVLGFDIKVQFTYPKNNTQATGIEANAPKKQKYKVGTSGITVIIDGKLNKATRHTYPVPKYIENYPDNGRLCFLKDLLVNKACTLIVFSEETGIPAYSIRQIFLRDNIRVSTIMAIAQKLGLNIIWKLTKKEI